MSVESQVLELVGMIYETVTDPLVWTAVLQRYTELVSADMSLLQVHDLAERSSTILGAFGISSPFTHSYNEHYGRLNTWREKGRGQYIAGRVNLDEELCPRRTLVSSEFYNDYLLRLGAEYSIGAVILRQGECAPTLTALRRKSKPAFGESERESAKILLPHMRRAWTLQERLELLDAGEAVLEMVPVGVVVLGRSGKVAYCNREAERVLQEKDGLTVEKGLLTATERAANDQLRKAVKSARSMSVAHGPDAVAVPRRSLRRDYYVVVAPLRGRRQPFRGYAKPAVAVLITDPEKHRRARTDLLIQFYKLTPKEAALASKLSEGRSIEQASEELAITYETARTHLRRVLAKTGTSRQADLLLLMMKLPPLPDAGWEQDESGR